MYVFQKVTEWNCETGMSILLFIKYKIIVEIKEELLQGSLSNLMVCVRKKSDNLNMEYAHW